MRGLLHCSFNEIAKMAVKIYARKNAAHVEL